MTEDRFQMDFNKVDNLTAVCKSTIRWPGEEYPELKIGETYNVTHIGVFRSSTGIILEGFGMKEYSAGCFDLFEGSKPLGHTYTREFRFWAPYLRERYLQRSPAAYEERLKEDAIRAELRTIEIEHGIKVLLAAQTGSRALGLDSPDSDWDVGYLYVYETERYSQETEHSCFIEQVCSGDIDAYGWELSDALAHLKAGNPTLLEWLNSNTYYIDESFSDIGRVIREVSFSPTKAIAYYYQIYTKNNERFLHQDGSLKAFLYYLRGLLACKWIESKGTMPPKSFGYLVDSTVENEGIKAKVNALVKIKRSGESTDGFVVEADLIDYARRLAEYYEVLLRGRG